MATRQLLAVGMLLVLSSTCHAVDYLADIEMLDPGEFRDLNNGLMQGAPKRFSATFQSSDDRLRIGFVERCGKR